MNAMCDGANLMRKERDKSESYEEYFEKQTRLIRIMNTHFDAKREYENAILKEMGIK